MEWSKINTDWIEPYVLGMDLPVADTYSVATQEVLICYTTKDAIGQTRKHYDLGWFDWDGDNWYCQLQYNNKHKVQEYLAWAPFDRYNL